MVKLQFFNSRPYKVSRENLRNSVSFRQDPVAHEGFEVSCFTVPLDAAYPFLLLQSVSQFFPSPRRRKSHDLNKSQTQMKLYVCYYSF